MSGKSVKMTWYGGQVSRELHRVLARRTHQAARMIANQLADNLSTPGPEPSVPGEFPHAQSRELLSSIRVEYDDDSARVVVDAPHAQHVEKIRPFFERTHDDMEGKLVRFMSQPID